MTTPLRAATVLVLRPAAAADELEVLMVRRGHKASFMANSYVFPGGRVDPADAQPDPALATRRCAARELSEEAGVQMGEPELAAMVYFARWITPQHEPRRFDTDFFLSALPAGQSPQVDAREVFDLQWLTPAEALRRYLAGDLNLPPPTACTLEDLQTEWTQLQNQARAVGSTADLAQLLRACQRRRPQAVLPKLQLDPSGGVAIVMPWDAEYPSLPGEGEPVRELAAGATAVPGRIRRCILTTTGVWQITR